MRRHQDDFSQRTYDTNYHTKNYPPKKSDGQGSQTQYSFYNAVKVFFIPKNLIDVDAVNDQISDWMVEENPRIIPGELRILEAETGFVLLYHYSRDTRNKSKMYNKRDRRIGTSDDYEY